MIYSDTVLLVVSRLLLIFLFQTFDVMNTL